LEKFVGVFEGNGDASASGNQAAENNLPADGPEWIELFVSEMSCATSVDDARARAAKLLEVLEKSISANVSSGAMTDLQRVCVCTVIDFLNGSLFVLLEFVIGNLEYNYVVENNHGLQVLSLYSGCPHKWFFCSGKFDVEISS
jgi:hypothetical protein